MTSNLTKGFDRILKENLQNYYEPYFKENIKRERRFTRCVLILAIFGISFSASLLEKYFPWWIVFPISLGICLFFVQFVRGYYFSLINKGRRDLDKIVFENQRFFELLDPKTAHEAEQLLKTIFNLHGIRAEPYRVDTQVSIKTSIIKACLKHPELRESNFLNDVVRDAFCYKP